MDTAKTKLSASFRWLNATQFLGAFNDNLFKLLLILFLIGVQGQGQASNVMATAGAVFVVPFLLFLALAGKLADSFSKRNIIVLVKLAEIVVMVVGCAAFMLGSVVGLYVVLFMMAMQSAFFGPCKYGIVPELVDQPQLSRANGILEALTYLAIILGTASATVLLQITGGNFVLSAMVCIAIALVGFTVSFGVGKTPAAGAERKVSLFFVRDIWRTLWLIRRNRYLLITVFASAYFLLIGALIYANLIPYGIQQLGMSNESSGQLFVLVAIGIGLGAYGAGRLSGRNVEFGMVPLGAWGLTLCAIGLGLIGDNKTAAYVLIFFMGLSGGFYIVPVHAFLQLRSPKKRRGQVLAASSFLGWVGVLLASGLIYLCSDVLGVSAAGMFLILGSITLALSIVTIVLLPDFLVRLLFVLLTRICYRIKVAGIENVSADKSVLLVCNHVSWVDALLIGATQQRRIRFVMERGFYNKKWLRPICRLMKAIPISASDPPKKLIASLRQARAAMDEGFMVCVFAEGALTRNGMLRSFKGGFERITKGSKYEIVPVYIGGAWGSIFSYYYGKPLATLPKKFPYPVSVHFGKPMPSDSTASQIHQRVTELSCDYFDSLKSSRRSLGDHFVQTARKNWSRHCIADSGGKRLNYGQTLASAVALSRQIAPITDGQEKVGILLPPSAGGVLANLAVALLGKVSVNLNYVASKQARALAINQCGIKCVISSRRFIEKLENLESLPGTIYLEDIVKNVTSGSKIKAYLAARLVPRKILANARGFCADDLATVIYSSGSSGTPKGVMLSHHNILFNTEATRMVFRIRPDDNICAVLPFFHSFGYTCTLWLPLLSGVSASYCANPLDGATVAKMARENRSTLLFGTPTFLLNYTRKAKEEDFASLRYAVVGAEKLKQRVADSFEAKFGIRPMEGYGATELSPVVTLNLPDAKSPEVQQIGNKDASIGHPIPGVAVKVVDLESHEPLGVGKDGLLMVKGPNVMAGYLEMEKETAEVLKDGWYNTGDIGRVDEDGFLTITDRLSRFSKIGGEMVPHVGVEEVYQQGLDTDEQVVAVTSVPDDRKGEELVVLYLAKAGDADRLCEIIAGSDVPNMWKPRRNNYVKVESMPILGSGKLDILKLRKIALDAKSV